MESCPQQYSASSPQIDSPPQLYPDLLNHNKLSSSPADYSGAEAEAAAVANPPALRLRCGFHKLPDELCESVKEPVIIPLMSFHQQEAKPGQMC